MGVCSRKGGCRIAQLVCEMIWGIGSDEGEIYTTGSNDFGQLGAKGREAQLIPVRVAALDTHIVTHIACGPTHTVAVTGASS